jgi:hypothetical protein
VSQTNTDRSTARSDSRISAYSRAHVVYDKTTGEILHIHHTVSFPHGAPIHEPPETRARRLAGKAAGDNTDVLEVEPDQVNHDNPIRIDTVNRITVSAGKKA